MEAEVVFCREREVAAVGRMCRLICGQVRFGGEGQLAIVREGLDVFCPSNARPRELFAVKRIVRQDRAQQAPQAVQLRVAKRVSRCDFVF